MEKEIIRETTVFSVKIVFENYNFNKNEVGIGWSTLKKVLIKWREYRYKNVIIANIVVSLNVLYVGSVHVI